MPLRDFRCPQHGAFEDLVHYSVTDMPCPKCSQMSKVLLSAPARTAGRWGDTGARYISAFGKELTPMQADAEARKRGLVHERDLPQHFIEDKLASEWKDARDHDKVMEKFTENKRLAGGDASQAWAETFSVDAMEKSGLISEVN